MNICSAQIHFCSLASPKFHDCQCHPSSLAWASEPFSGRLPPQGFATAMFATLQYERKLLDSLSDIRNESHKFIGLTCFTGRNNIDFTRSLNASSLWSWACTYKPLAVKNLERHVTLCFQIRSFLSHGFFTVHTTTIPNTEQLQLCGAWLIQLVEVRAWISKFKVSMMHPLTNLQTDLW